MNYIEGVSGEGRGDAIVIVPAFNEEATITAVITEIRTTRPDLDIVVVNDGSTDTTSQLARTAGVPVLDMPFNVGVGGAMRAGFRYAERFGYQRAFQVDADGQHDPSAIALLEAELQRADVVVGSRFTTDRSYDVHGPRRWMMRLLSRSVSAICGVRIDDTTSGFRGSSRSAIELFAASYPTEYLGDTVESLLLAHFSGLKLAQTQTPMRQRVAGNSTAAPLRAIAYLARILLVIVITRKSTVSA
jgi:glycosyltransferase involved in cell wall biosynthesis